MGKSFTSDEANKKAAKVANAAKVMEVLRVAGINGILCDEIEQKAGISHQTCSATLNSLEKHGQAIATSRTDPTRTGRAARRYMMTDFLRDDVDFFLISGRTRTTP